MNKKVLGFLTPLSIVVLLFLVLIVTALVVNSTSSDGWAALGAVMMVFMLGGLVLIVFLIVSIVMYARKQTEYWLWSLYGYVGIIGLSVLVGLVTAIYNSLIV